MKKIYQIPTTKVIRIAVQHLMAGSEQLGFGDGVNTAAGADSREGFGFFDDDSDDEW